MTKSHWRHLADESFDWAPFHNLSSFSNFMDAVEGTMEFAQKKPMTHTETQTTTHEAKPEFDDLHSGGAAKRKLCVLRYRKPRGAFGGFHYFAWDRLYQTDTATLPSGLACWSEIGACSTTNQWLTAGSLTRNTDSVIAWFDLNPNRQITGSALYTGLTQPLEDTFALRSTRHIFDLTSFTNVLGFCKIHAFMSKRDQNVSPMAHWLNDATSAGLGTVGYGISMTSITGNAGANFPIPFGGGTSANGNYEVGAQVGQTPYIYPEFNRDWKHIVCHPFILGGASTHKFELTLVHNVSQKRDQLNQLNVTYPKGAVVFVFERYGQVTLNTQSTPNLPHHGVLEVGIVTKNQAKFQAVEGNAARLYSSYAQVRENAGNTVPTAGGGSKDQMMDVNDAVSFVKQLIE